MSKKESQILEQQFFSETMRSEDSQLPTNQLMRSNTVKQKLNKNAMEHLMHLPREKRSHVLAYG